MEKLQALQFIKEARSELKKVVWPSKKETIRLTAIVLGVSLVVSLYLGLLDFTFTKLIEMVVK